MNTLKRNHDYLETHEDREDRTPKQYKQDPRCHNEMAFLLRDLFRSNESHAFSVSIGDLRENNRVFQKKSDPFYIQKRLPYQTTLLLRSSLYIHIYRKGKKSELFQTHLGMFEHCKIHPIQQTNGGDKTSST